MASCFVKCQGYFLYGLCSVSTFPGCELFQDRHDIAYLFYQVAYVCSDYCSHGSALQNLALKMNPVVSQPGYGTGGVMHSDWQSGVFDCCDDLGICLCGTFFPLCLSCQIASDMNECCLCGASVAMRTLYRTRYGIPGSICSDFLWLGCFPHCTLCQLKRDIEKRKAMNAF
ncbi:placenta-specific gene 8 protein-like isoform X1 [Panthera pardus]|nr:placenta-specific gene 8 protein-like isoform X1 [Panthera pardus]XP_060510687.1 placenta-specific gene 8 protein-like isoform X1 [Panthera onca]